MQREIIAFRQDYYKEFENIFDTFRKNGYEEIWPGVTQGEYENTKKKFEEIYYWSFNVIITRCFGWGLPKTSFIPFADCINHHNVDSTYEFICEELHEPLRDLKDKNDTYSVNINEFIEENKKDL